MYDHLVKADLSYHKAEQSGNVTSRVTTDTVALGTGIQVLINFASQALLIVSTFRRAKYFSFSLGERIVPYKMSPLRKLKRRI